MSTLRSSPLAALVAVFAPTGLALGACVEPEPSVETEPVALSQGGWSLADQQLAVAARQKLRDAARKPALRDQVPAAEWIATAYHGQLLDANLDEIEPDAANLEKMQGSMFDMLHAATLAKVKQTYGADLAELFDADLQGLDRLVARGGALHGMISVADAQLRFRFEGRLRHMRTILGGLIGIDPQAVSPYLSELLARYDLRDWYVLPPIQFSYVDTCRSAGVPIPPDWPDPRWIRQGPLVFTFISERLDTNVYTYRDPAVAGVCYALPRTAAGTTDDIRLLGIICQSDTTGRACFWDNLGADGVRLTGTAVNLDIDTIANGSNLAENCSGCHRGRNAFLIHPGTALDLSGAWGRPPVGGPWDTDPSVRYRPIGQAHWQNPAPVTLPSVAAPERSCTGCHEIPGTTPVREGDPSYCDDVLRDAAMFTMPPADTPAGWWPSVRNPAYRTHLSALAACP